MGCIEIYIAAGIIYQCFGLIETWDVLKFYTHNHIPIRVNSLIETWDVLKYLLTGFFTYLFPGLIETWDVLK